MRRDFALVALVLHAASTAPFCVPAGERDVVVPTSSEAAFRRGLRTLGYAVFLADRHGALAPVDGGDPAAARL
jgi:hypothetical protein